MHSGIFVQDLELEKFPWGIGILGNGIFSSSGSRPEVMIGDEGKGDSRKVREPAVACRREGP